MATLRADYVSAVERTRVWYVSSGQDVAFITYTGSGSDAEAEEREIRDGDTMVRSIVF
jgi:hypothetical protein